MFNPGWEAVPCLTVTGNKSSLVGKNLLWLLPSAMLSVHVHAVKTERDNWGFQDPGHTSVHLLGLVSRFRQVLPLILGENREDSKTQHITP